MTPHHDADFVSAMARNGTSPSVAAEIERRIEIVNAAEGSDSSRFPLSVAELSVYVGVSVAACVIGIAVVAL